MKYKKVSMPSADEMIDYNLYLSGKLQKMDGYDVGKKKTFADTTPTSSDKGERCDIWIADNGRTFWHSGDQWYEYEEEDAKCIKLRSLNGVERRYIALDLIPGHREHEYMRLDKEAIGTSKYKGHAYFWDTEYKHYLRPQRREILLEIHDALLDAGLNVGEVSDEHEKIILDLSDEGDKMERASLAKHKEWLKAASFGQEIGLMHMYMFFHMAKVGNYDSYLKELSADEDKFYIYANSLAKYNWIK